jgi:hypothetical protein
MANTPEQNLEIFIRFHQRLRIKNTLTIIYIVVVTLCLLFMHLAAPAESSVFRERAMVIVLAFAALFTTLDIFYWRCPGCRKWLGISTRIKFCGQCGVRLRP